MQKECEKNQSTGRPSNGAFLKKQPILNTNVNGNRDILRVEKKRWRIIEFIKEHPDCTIYSVAKGLKINYSTTHSALRELVFARVLATKSGVDSNENPVDLFFIPEKEVVGCSSN